MPTYIYEHPKTKEIKEIVQRMMGPHEYTDDKGIKWNRVFAVPQASFDTKIDAFSESQFVRKTGRSENQKVGDVWDRSKELSAKRATKNGGVDPMKEKFFKEYSKARKGKPHPSQGADAVYTI